MKHLTFFMPLILLSCALSAQVHLLSNDPLMDPRSTDMDSAYRILSKKKKQSIKNGDPVTEFEIAKCLAIIKMRKRDFNAFDSLSKIAEQLKMAVPNTSFDWIYERSRLNFFLNKGDFAQADSLLRRMEKTALGEKDIPNILNFYCLKSRYYILKGDKAEAHKYMYLADSLNIHYESPVIAARIFRLKARFVFDEDKAGAIRLYQKAIELYGGNGRDYQTLPIYRNMISAAITLGRKADALQWDETLKVLQKKYATTGGYFIGEVNRVFFYIQMEHYQRALSYADTVMMMGREKGWNVNHLYYLKGIAYRGLNQYKKAALLIEKAYDTAKLHSTTGRMAYYAYALYQTYLWRARHASALHWFTTYAAHRDTLYNEEKLKEIDLYKAKLETLSQQKKVAGLEAQAAINKQRNRVIRLTFGIIVLTILSLLYIQKLRNKTRMLAKQAELVESVRAKEMLVKDLQVKENELSNQLIFMADKNSLLMNIKEDLKNVKSAADIPFIRRMIHRINLSLENENTWEQFLNTFKNLHTGFFKKLNSLASDLTANDIRLASLMKMNLSAKDISSILNITDAGVKKARYRLRKKLGIESEDNVQEYLLTLS